MTIGEIPVGHSFRTSRGGTVFTVIEHTQGRGSGASLTRVSFDNPYSKRNEETTFGSGQPALPEASPEVAEADPTNPKPS